MDAEPTATVPVSVKLFGVQAQLAGAAAAELEVRPGVTTVAELRRALAAAAPPLAPSLGSSRFAVDHAYAAEDRVLGGTEELALIGLVGGG